MTGRVVPDSLIEYDRNGNLDYMIRYNEGTTATTMDYNHYANSNKAEYVGGTFGQNSLNYVYDPNGNVVKDKKKLGTTAADTVGYDYRNLPIKLQKSVSPGGTIYFSYDGKGQRVSKNNLFYISGADGRVIAVYDLNGTHLYWNVWGLDLIGQRYWKQ